MRNDVIVSCNVASSNIEIAMLFPGFSNRSKLQLRTGSGSGYKQIFPICADNQTSIPMPSVTLSETDVAMTTRGGKEEEFLPQQKLTSLQLLFARFVYISTIVYCYLNADVIQGAIGEFCFVRGRRNLHTGS